MLIDYGRYFDKEAQKALLEREGHIIEQPDPNKHLYRVQNYKAELFDLNKLIINEQVSCFSILLAKSIDNYF